MVLTKNRWHIWTHSPHSNTHNKTHFFSLSEKNYFVTWKTLHLHSSGHVTWKRWVGFLGELISLIRDSLSSNLKIMVNAFRNSSLSMASQLCMAKSCMCAIKSTTGRSMLCILLFSCEDLLCWQWEAITDWCWRWQIQRSCQHKPISIYTRQCTQRWVLCFIFFKVQYRTLIYIL